MTVKRTFSLPDDVAARLEAVAPAGHASAYVTEALREKQLRDETAERIRAVWGEPDPVAMAEWVARFTGETQGQAQAS